MAASLKIAHTGAANVSFLKTLATVLFSLHVGNLFLLHLHRTQATSIPFQHFPLIGVQISCLAQHLKHLFHVLSLTNHAWWTWFFLISCVEAWLFLLQWRFISLPNILMNSSRFIIISLFVFSIKVIQIGAIRSTETCRLAFIIVVIIMLFQRGVWKIFVYEVSAALDTKFNGLCVSAKTKFKIGTNEVPSLDQVLNHFSYDLSYLSIPFWTTCTYVAVFSSIYPILLVCF